MSAEFVMGFGVGVAVCVLAALAVLNVELWRARRAARRRGVLFGVTVAPGFLCAPKGWRCPTLEELQSGLCDQTAPPGGERIA